MISSIKNLIELFAYLFCLAGMFNKKFKLNIYAVIFIILDLFLLKGINEYNFPEYMQLLVYLGMFLYGLMSYKCTVRKTVLNSFLSAALITICQMLLYLPVFYIFIQRKGQNILYELIINLGCLFFIILLYQKEILKRISEFFFKNDKLLIIVAILMLLGLGRAIYKVKEFRIITQEDYIQIIYFLFLFGFSILEWQKSRMEVEKRKTQIEMNKLYYDAYDQLIILIRDKQHDMKNHINAILGMIHTTNNYDDLVMKQQEYCGYVIEQNEKAKLLVSAGNPLIIGFLYNKIQEAEREGISVEYEIGIKKEVAVPEYEIIEILGILFDNSIDALMNNEEPKKHIYISLKEYEEKLVLIVANTSAKFKEEIIEKFFERGYSDKGEYRGIGLFKLKRMVQNYDGTIIVSNEMNNEENYLTFEICIPKVLKKK